MGVYIRGMEMPKNCSECKLVTQYYDGGSDICCLLDKHTDCKVKLDDCTIVEVPDSQWIKVTEQLPGDQVKVSSHWTSLPHWMQLPEPPKG